MRRKRRRISQHKQTPSEFHFRPFGAIARHAVQPASPPPDSQKENEFLPEAPAESDQELFEREMADVRRLAPEERSRVPRPPALNSQIETTSEEAEVLAELSELVAGNGDFDITDTIEYVEGSVVGLDPRLVRRLRAGEFAYQSYLDLHGMSREEARAAVDRFLVRAYQRGHRCVLIVHGRGLNSEGKLPVLKKWLLGWLSRGPGARMVLAFTSARACDGGAGALYVLLRQQRRSKQRIRVTEGSKV
jgi:DNA-nicking Smr family endonuclease